MKKCTWMFAFVAIALLSASAANGQVIVGAGSSGVWPSIALSAITGDPITGIGPICGSNFWTGGSGSSSSLAFGVDNRTGPGGPIPKEPGTLWVAWDNDTAPTKVCTDLNVDSVVGTRLFLELGAGNANATLSVLATAQYTVGANKVSFAKDNTTCAAGSVPLVVNGVSITEGAGSKTATATGAFTNVFANGATVTIAGSSVAAYNGTFVIGGVTQLGPTSFTFSTTTAGNGADTGGDTATATQNCPGIPAAVYSLINNAHFTVGFSDIRPEDGLYAEQRASAAAAPNDPTTPNMGYGNNPILSSFSQALAYPWAFQVVAGQPDPYTAGTSLPAYSTQAIGAYPILVLGNITDAGACSLKNINNVTWQALGNVYSGQGGATQDLSPALSQTITGCVVPMPVVEREPLSGTYNTFEWQIVRTRSGNNGRSQENNNVGYIKSNLNPIAGACAAWTTTLPGSASGNVAFPPAGFGANSCGNPLNVQLASYSTDTSQAGAYGGFGGNRVRAIGSGEMITAVNSADVSAKNALGYTFWSTGSLGGKVNLKYFTVDGVDPLYPSYSTNGVLALGCTGFVNAAPAFSCTSPQPTFDGIANGQYRSFNRVRAIYFGGLSTCSAPFTAVTIGCLLQAAQDQAKTNVHDFLPVQYCNNASCSAPISPLTFFRSHYAVSGLSASNGNISPACVSVSPNVGPESGGDMAGAIFPIQADYTLQNAVGCTAQVVGDIQ